jgi:hypothetical protein
MGSGARTRFGFLFLIDGTDTAAVPGTWAYTAP